MTDRYHSLTVVLEKDIRADDAEDLIKAMKMLRHVITVKGNVSDFNFIVAQERAVFDLGQQVLAVIYPKIYGVPRE